MKFTPINPPREFEVGREAVIKLKDCARIELEPNEQVTFKTESGGEYDVARKSWGFYATPSLNKRLPKFGFRAALAKSPDGRFYVFLAERGKEKELEDYINLEHLKIIYWLDSDEKLEELERVLANQ